MTQSLTSAGFDIVAEAANAPDAVRLVVDLRPDVVLMDLRLPDRAGVKTVEQITLLAPASRVLILTRTEENRVVEAIVAGASGYILKTATPEEIIAPAVKATAGGESVISSQIAGKLLQRIRGPPRDMPVTATSDNATECNPRRPNPARGGDFRAATAERAIRTSRTNSRSAETPSTTTLPASCRSCTWTTASKQPSKPCEAASPEATPGSTLGVSPGARMALAARLLGTSAIRPWTFNEVECAQRASVVCFRPDELPPLRT